MTSAEVEGVKAAADAVASSVQELECLFCLGRWLLDKAANYCPNPTLDRTLRLGLKVAPWERPTNFPEPPTRVGLVSLSVGRSEYDSARIRKKPHAKCFIGP